MNWLDAQHIIDSFGDWAAIAVTIVIFIETAFILTSFLPGDSLLFLTGLTLSASDSWMPDWLGFLMIWLAAFIGTQTGYWVGYKIGPPLFEKKNGWILNRHVLEKTHDFFDRYGTRAILLARFIPILRALIPMLAGITKMDIKKFTRLNFYGATLWVGVFMFGGYWLGQFEFIHQNLEATVLVIVVVTTMMIPFEYLRDRLARRRKVARSTR